MTEVPAWLISFFTTLLAAFFGYLIAVKKFKKEKWWQEKYQSYQDILSALESMILWADETYCNHKMLPTIGTHSLKEGTVLTFAESRRVIAKASCIGKLLITQQVVDLLEALEKDLWDEDFRAEDENYSPETFDADEAIARHAENVKKLVQPRLENIIKLAKRDLA